MDFTYSPTYAGDSLPYFSMIFMIAEPTIAPSEIEAIFLACSGVEIPNPMAQGTLVFSRIILTIESRSVLISVHVPVTPRLDTR